MPEANPSEGTTTGTLERLKIGDGIYKVEGGGSGGTSDYDALNNKPQIAGTTLSGNKSLADLGIASASAVSGILDGTNIDSFGDVETALGSIKDGQSIDSFADVETAIGAITDGTTIDSFADVETALAGKQDALTVGSHIAIDDDTISVNRWAIPAGKVVYTVITSDENYGQNVHVQRHTLGGAFIDDRTFLCQMYKTVTIDDLISIWNPYSSLTITLLEDSDEHTSGYSYTVNPIGTATSNSFTFMMEQEENDNDLIIREELDEVSSAVNAIKDGQSIDSFADVETALATKADLTDLAPAFSDSTAYAVGKYVSYEGNIYKCTSAHSAGAWAAGDFTLVAVGSELESKQNATDNSLNTTAKTIVGAINEHEGDIATLKSGLTDVNSNLTNSNLQSYVLINSTAIDNTAQTADVSLGNYNISDFDFILVGNSYYNSGIATYGSLCMPSIAMKGVFSNDLGCVFKDNQNNVNISVKYDSTNNKFVFRWSNDIAGSYLYARGIKLRG